MAPYNSTIRERYDRLLEINHTGLHDAAGSDTKQRTFCKGNVNTYFVNVDITVSTEQITRDTRGPESAIDREVGQTLKQKSYGASKMYRLIATTVAKLNKRKHLPHSVIPKSLQSHLRTITRMGYLRETTNADYITGGTADSIYLQATAAKRQFRRKPRRYMQKSDKRPQRRERHTSETKQKGCDASLHESEINQLHRCCALLKEMGLQSHHNN